MLSAGSSEIQVFDLWGRDQKDVRRKVTQIHGGITSGSGLFIVLRQFVIFNLLYIVKVHSLFVPQFSRKSVQYTIASVNARGSSVVCIASLREY